MSSEFNQLKWSALISPSDPLVAMISFSKLNHWSRKGSVSELSNLASLTNRKRKKVKKKSRKLSRKS